MTPNPYQQCLDQCYACAAACNYCATACLSEGHAEAMAQCIRLDIECAEVCTLAANTMARESAFSAEICAVCAKVCEACAAVCDKHEEDHCQRCAAACRACADSCRSMYAELSAS